MSELVITALDTHELAWAAGLFDAEGSICVSMHHRRHVYSPQISVSQGGKELPEVLIRFRAAVGDLGSFVGPVRGYLYYWYSHRFATVQAVSALLWPWLSPVKRQQVRRTLLLARGVPYTPSELANPSGDFAHELDWAAGFFAGEADVGATVYFDGYRRRFIRASISQASGATVAPTLLRFRRAVLDIGTIQGPYIPRNPWSKLPQYRWEARSYEGVQAVIALLWPRLDTKTRTKARRALFLYRSPRPSLAELRAGVLQQPRQPVPQ